MIALVQRRRGPSGWSLSQRHLGWPSDVTQEQKERWKAEYEETELNNITTIQTTIYQVIAEQLGILESQIILESTLDSLGVDSLDKVEIVMTLEERFGIEITDGEMEAAETVDQVIDLVVRLRP